MLNKFRDNLKKNKGVTLVEVLLSVALLAIILVPTMNVILTVVKSNTVSKDRTEAVAIAENVMGEIKAKRVITPSAVETMYPLADTGNLTAYAQIELLTSGAITTSAISSYDPNEANDADLELIIDTGTDVSTFQKVTFNSIGLGGAVDATKTFSNLPVNTDMRLRVTNAGSNYQYNFYNDTDSFSGSFTPKSDVVKLRVSYQGITPPSSSKQLKIFTYADCDKSLKAYVLNNEEFNSGVNFLNKSSKEFEINYMNTQAFNITEPLNRLFKVTVNIKKGSNTIFTTSSFVKK